METQQECPIVKQFNESHENSTQTEAPVEKKEVNDTMYYAYGMCYGKCSTENVDLQ